MELIVGVAYDKGDDDGDDGEEGNEVADGDADGCAAAEPTRMAMTMMAMTTLTLRIGAVPRVGGRRSDQ